jgi:hypothetical protein
MKKTNKLFSVEQIFETYNIQKSIFVCLNDNISWYYNKMINKDFPISQIHDVKKFNFNMNRILLIDEYDAANFELITNICNISSKDVSLIIYIDNVKKIKELDFIPKIIL